MPMDRTVTYRATDPNSGMTAQEVRDALRTALTIVKVVTRGVKNPQIVRLDVIEADPGTRIEGND